MVDLASIDWFSWVLIALMGYFLGKGMYFYGSHQTIVRQSEELRSIIEERKVDEVHKLATEERQQFANYMMGFYIVLIVFVVRETYHLWS